MKNTEVGIEEIRSPVPVKARSSAAVLVASKSSLSLPARADRLWIRTLPTLRYQLARFGIANLAGALCVVSAMIAALVFLLPARQALVSLNDQLAAAAHSQQLPAQPTLTPYQFAGSLPTRAQVPALLGTVFAQAASAGVSLEQGRYSFSPAAANRLARYSLEFPIKSDYASIRSFINKSLGAIPALGLEKLRVERKNVGDTGVHAEVAFVIYLRGP